MTGQRILLTGLCIAILGTVIGSGDAQARNRCRGGYASGGRNSGYASNSGCNQNGYGTSQAAYGTSQTGCSSGCNVNPAMSGMNTTPMNGTVNSTVPNQQWNGAPQQWNGTPQPVNGATPQWNAATQQWVTTPTNQGVIQTNGTYSAGKPNTNDVGAPQPVTGTAPANNNFGNPNTGNRTSDAVQQNTSPDVDNEGRGASKIQGTAPSKAPLPAATTNP